MCRPFEIFTGNPSIFLPMHAEKLLWLPTYVRNHFFCDGRAVRPYSSKKLEKLLKKCLVMLQHISALWQRWDRWHKHNLSSPIKAKWLLRCVWNAGMQHLVCKVAPAHCEWYQQLFPNYLLRSTPFVSFLLWCWHLVPDAALVPSWRESNWAENVTWTGLYANNWTGNKVAGR